MARHQNPDGSWSPVGYTRQCRPACAPNPGSEDYQTGVTGLSLLAFVGAGYSHLSKDTYDGLCFGDVVRKGLQWLKGRQDADGCLGSRSAEKYMYSHAIAALALSEAYGWTGSQLLQASAQNAIDFLVAAQNPGRGWRYAARSGDSDTSVTGWAVMALRSAALSGLALPHSALDGARAWLDEVTDASTAAAGYTHLGTGKVFIPGLNQDFENHETMTAIAAASRVFLGRGGALSRQGAGRLQQDLPRADALAVDYYYWYCGTLAVFQ